VNDYNARVGGDTYTALCRDGDPVQFLPLGFASQCSYNGAAASWLIPIKNHLMTYWTQCQSGRAASGGACARYGRRQRAWARTMAVPRSEALP
jgi:hypothetical protein